MNLPDWSIEDYLTANCWLLTAEFRATLILWLASIDLTYSSFLPFHLLLFYWLVFNTIISYVGWLLTLKYVLEARNVLL